MQKIRLIMLMTLALILAGLPVFAATVYVNPGDSIQAAIDSAGDGDTVIVKAGTYNETITIWNKNKLTIKGAGQGITIIDGSLGSANVVDIRDSNNIKFMNITVTGAAAGYYNLYMNYVLKCFISRCDFTYAATDNGISVTYVQGMVLQKCYIAHNGVRGAYINQARNAVIKSCVFEENSIHGLVIDQSHSVLVKGNSIMNNGAYGLYVDYTKALVVQQNTISGNTSYGVYEYNFGGYSVYSKNNIINNQDAGVMVESFGFPLFIRNTISGNNSDGIYCGLYGVYPTLIQNIISGNMIAGVFLHYTSGYLAKNTITGNSAQGVFTIANEGSASRILTLVGNRIMSNGSVGVSYYDVNPAYPGTLQASRNMIVGNGDMGVYIDIAQLAFLDRNTISDNEFSGVYISSSATGATVMKNFIANNGDYGLYGTYDSVIAMNRILSNGWQGTYQGMYGFYYSHVYRNTVMYNTGYGIDASLGDQSFIENNKAFYNGTYDLFNDSANNAYADNKYGTADF